MPNWVRHAWYVAARSEELNIDSGGALSRRMIERAIALEDSRY